MSTLVDYKPREIVDNASTARAPLSAGHVHGRRFWLNLADFAISPGLGRSRGSSLGTHKLPALDGARTQLSVGPSGSLDVPVLRCRQRGSFDIAAYMAVL